MLKFLYSLFKPKKLKIALYGGAFNPPTLGHIDIVDYVSEMSIIDEVWILPTSRNYHNKSMLDFSERFAMCQMAFKEIMLHHGFIKLKSYEYAFRSRSDGSVSDLMQNMKELYKGHNVEFYFVIGQDNADEISKWKNYESLIKEVPFIVIPRKHNGVTNELSWYDHHPHQLLDVNIKGDVSSTKIRQLICDNRDNLDDVTVAEEAHKIVSKDMWEYIVKTGTYTR